jgi:hypothetical protein
LVNDSFTTISDSPSAPREILSDDRSGRDERFARLDDPARASRSRDIVSLIRGAD